MPSGCDQYITPDAGNMCGVGCSLARRVPPEGGTFRCVTPNPLILERFKQIEAIEPEAGSTVQNKDK